VVLPHKKKWEDYFWAKYYVKLGHFVHFSGKCHVKFAHFVHFLTYIFGQKCLPPNVEELLRLCNEC